MTNDPRLERYLTSLEQALRPFPVSDRAEIITEIKSHILDALDRDPQTRLDTVLTALGEPETVANRYLLERGTKPAKTSIHPIVKWLVIGFLATLAMFLIFAGFLITRFGKVVEVDEHANRVRMLDGLIDVKGTSRPSFKGTAAIAADGSLKVTFLNGDVAFVTSKDSSVEWSCEGSDPQVVATETPSELKFDSRDAIDCRVMVPAGSHLTAQAENGEMRLRTPRFNVTAELANGEIEFKGSRKEAYKFDSKVDNGKASDFTSSNKADAYAIKLHVKNGEISNDN